MSVCVIRYTEFEEHIYEDEDGSSKPYMESSEIKYILKEDVSELPHAYNLLTDNGNWNDCQVFNSKGIVESQATRSKIDEVPKNLGCTGTDHLTGNAMCLWSSMMPDRRIVALLSEAAEESRIEIGIWYNVSEKGSKVWWDLDEKFLILAKTASSCMHSIGIEAASCYTAYSLSRRGIVYVFELPLCFSIGAVQFLHNLGAFLDIHNTAEAYLISGEVRR